MEPDDLLCSRNARPPKALAWANGTSWRADGWAGEKAAHSERPIRPAYLFQYRAIYCDASSEVVLLRQAMMSLASAMGSIVKGAVC